MFSRSKLHEYYKLHSLNKTNAKFITLGDEGNETETASFEKLDTQAVDIAKFLRVKLKHQNGKTSNGIIGRIQFKLYYITCEIEMLNATLFYLCTLQSSRFSLPVHCWDAFMQGILQFPSVLLILAVTSLT